ncbi:Protein fmp52, mitochondrial [Cladophialophora chaetospira]|uniref:Protein fmp52, mitochondrial n=1 Tax=Cladophialophora chaetospira TaxID=386627 RepID=A0AA38X8X6_9EURO|nr:Protein fmp52, mitochondrial [Cladophialophora chaetospira]
MTASCLVGGTGLVGSHILSTLMNCSTITSLDAFTRSNPESPSTSKLRYISDLDSTTWPSLYPLKTQVFFSALGTTARKAGSFANQRKIDYDLNIALAKAAKQAGVDVFVLVSTSGASTTSMIPYSKMKGELDEAVKALGFRHTVILKPGLLVGTRTDSRPGEFAARKVASMLGMISGNRLKDSWAQDAEVVAKAAVKAGLDAIHGEYTGSVTVLDQHDIIRLGRTDWLDI